MIRWLERIQSNQVTLNGNEVEVTPSTLLRCVRWQQPFKLRAAAAVTYRAPLVVLLL